VNRFRTLLRSLLLDDDALARHRNSIAIRLCLLAAVLLVPFLLRNLAVGRLGLASVVVIAMAVLLVNAGVLHRLGRPPIPYSITVVALCAAVGGAIALNGLNSLPWIYPMLFVTYFVVERRRAHLIALTFIGGVATLLWRDFGPEVTAPVAASMLLIVFMLNVVLNVIGELQRALFEQAITDPLTGAFNRRHLASQLERLTTPGSAPQRPNALIAIDIDHFKSINDRHGHAGGDEVLRQVVKVIGTRKRRSDLLFRTGGEEFVLLLPDTTTEEAEHLAQALRQLIEQAPLLPSHPVTVSLGVSLQRPGHDVESWFGAADRALYEAKRTGRNRVVLAS
jgi:diguanylate cyclase (GGDEF)-like protein